MSVDEIDTKFTDDQSNGRTLDSFLPPVVMIGLQDTIVSLKTQLPEGYNQHLRGWR